MLPSSSNCLLASADAALLARVEPALASGGARIAVALSAQAALAALASPHPPHMALLDADLPGVPLEQLLAALRCGDSGRRLPILLIVDSVTPEWLARVDEGMLDDLVLRHAQGAYWQLRVARALQARRVQDELGAVRARLVRSEQRDPLTGVYCRAALLSLLFRETDRVQRLHGSLTLLMFAVDEFECWSRRPGGDADGELLREAARRAQRLLRSYDLMGRTGDGEFLLALPGCSATHAVAFAERLRAEAFAAPYRAGAETILLSACFGIAESRGRSPVVVVREAGQALARARQAGPGTIHTFDRPGARYCSMAEAMAWRTEAGSAGMAPDCEATHPPQRLPASLSVASGAPRSR